MKADRESDPGLQAVRASILEQDPDGIRIARVLRNTLDQLYDGQRTGRYRWDQLHKTEKTHCGTLIEINLHREFGFNDGSVLDYEIAGVDVDCKYSQKLFAWMIPPEAHGHLCLLLWAHDETDKWQMGLTRIDPGFLGAPNRDGKASLNAKGRSAITWIFVNHALPPNVLLHLDREVVDRIMGLKSGQQRVNELFRNALGMRVGRGVIATVAQQDDYMKRVRGNGGARTALQPEGIVILGQFKSHAEIAHKLGLQAPRNGESIAVKLTSAERGDLNAAQIEGQLYRIAHGREPITAAPTLTKI